MRRCFISQKAPGAKTTEGESNHYKQVVKGRSKYVYLAAYEDTTDVYSYTNSVAITTSATAASLFHLYGPQSYSLSAGTDYNNYNVGNETQTYSDVFGDVETIKLITSLLVLQLLLRQMR